MSEHRTGKVTAEIFEQVILRRLGARDPSVVVGPARGVDVGVVQVAPGTVMALTSDPVFIVPAYGWVRAVPGVAYASQQRASADATHQPVCRRQQT